MKIIPDVSGLTDVLKPFRDKNLVIGFVPTMGALHEGHATLVRRCVAECDVCVVSVFVNPTQFNNKEDLKQYPRTLHEDCALLESIGVDVVFAPDENEMYPEPDTRVFDFGMLDKVMEGRFRPGHFNGVAQVVSKLFDMVRPRKAYFGEKDFQQLAVIRAMARDYGFSVQIIGVPIVREESGLAMSSRNRRLSAEEQVNAAAIYRTLRESTELDRQSSAVAQAAAFVAEKINKVPGLRVEYFDIVDGNSLLPVSSWDDSDYIIGCIAVFCGDVRLIDNIHYS